MRLLCLSLLFFSTALVAYAQESNCGDGVDNDGDGFVDCFDGDCRNNAICKDFYLGQDITCQATPTSFPGFSMKLEKFSADKVTYTSGRLAIGDLDKDGIPEVVTIQPDDKKIYILNGQDLSIKYTATVTGTAEYFDQAIADIKGDGCGDIFIAEVQSGTYYITSYDCKGNKQWSTQAFGQPITFGIADFGSDGKPEIYYRNEILDAATGTRLVKGSGSWSGIDAGPVAVDILKTTDCAGCAGLELVLGGSIYSVNLGARTLDAGTIKLEKTIPASANYFPKYSAGFSYVTSLTSIADYNLDGFLDVLTSGSTGSTTGTTTAFFWDVKNNTAKTYAPSTNWAHGTGRLNISDIDGDGKLNTTFVSGGRVFALKEDFTLLWSLAIIETTSGYTSATVFDFNNDKSNEVVYRDEKYLYIIDGKTGTISAKSNCASRTANEYPIVVDVDSDGATEICITCATNDNVDINVVANRYYGQVRVFSSNGSAWVPARKLWNQHGYFNVNVNDNLTIPQVQQLHNTVFSVGSPCNAGSNRPLNSFLNQSPFLDSKGCPTYAAPDLVFDPGSSITITPPTCPDQDFTVSFTIKNIGDLGISGTLPITFYSGDPTKAGAVKLNTVNLNVSSLNVNNTNATGTLTVNGTGKTFTLYMVLNDNGSTVPTPISLPNSTFAECNYANNYASATITPNPFTISTGLISDNFKCATVIGSPNGAVESYRLVSGVKQTVNYTFYWFNGATVADSSLAAYKGAIYSGLTEGTYSVFAVHKGFKCSSSAQSITVAAQSRTLTVNIIEDKVFTNCKNPNGKLHAEINGGDPVGNFTYEWYSGNSAFVGAILSKSHELTNADAITYTVVVTEKSTQCQSIKSYKVTDNATRPTVTATTIDANCSPANSGSATANVSGTTSGYTFNWYNGASAKPAADFTGSTYSNISAGSYSVTATDNSSGCVSSLVTTTVNSKSIQPVSASVTAQQTSCKATKNGAASANVAGVTAGFTWKWFAGNGTAPPVFGNSSTISALTAGVYTVQATDAAGCSDTEIVTIVDNISIPTVSTSINSHQTNCLPANGSTTANAAGSTGPFQYYWFNGNVGSPDTTTYNFKGATYTSLVAGFYTVVAVDKITRCSSARAVVQILNNTVNPTVATSTVNQTSCVVASPNGGASANVTAPAGSYKYRWWAGTDTTIVANFIVQASSISSRAAGTYTVKAVNIATGCFSTKLETITDAKVLPTLTLTPTSNSICNPGLTSPAVSYNGSVSATVTNQVGAITGYTFSFGGGAGVQGISPAHNTFTQLNGGITYTATATQTSTGCVSSVSSVQVLNSQTIPVLTTSNTGSTNCVAGKEDGQASVATVNGSPASASGFTYSWTGPVAPAFPVTAATNTSNTLQLIKVQGGAGYSYTVQVTDHSNGCQNTAVVNVADAKVLPTLTLTPTSNSICNPGLTSPAVPYNGKVTATVTNQVGAITGYTFSFGGGAGVQGISPAHNTFTQLNGGITYTATATQTSTGCVSSVSSVQVLNSQNIPVLTTSNTGSTNCVAGKEDGQAAVATVNGIAASASGFTYSWTGPVAPAFPVTAATNTSNTLQLIKVQGGAGYSYTVQVTDQSNGCQNTAVVNVADAKVLPTLTLTPTANSICNPGLTSPAVSYNGSVSATVTNQVGAITGYTFSFGGGAGVQGISPAHNTFTQLNGGITYTATATQTSTGCVSSVSSVQVLNAQTIPVLTTSNTGSTNCVAGKEDGQAAVATVNGIAASASGFTYSWTGPVAPAFPVTAATNTSNTLQLIKVQGGAGYSYTVQVTDQSNGCQNTAVVNVADAKVLPTLTLTPTSNSICDPVLTSPAVPYNGKVTVTVTNQVGAITGYTFSFGGGAGVQGISPAHNTFTQLNGGITYTATATQTSTGCVSSVSSVQVLNSQTIPVLTTSNTGSTNCVAGKEDGQAAVATVNGIAASASGFTYSWTGPVAPAFPVTAATNTSNTLQLIKVQGGAGYSYTVQVTDQSNGCQNTAVVNVADAKVLPTLTLTPTSNSICNPGLTFPAVSYNGSVSATVTNQLGAITGYTFSFGGGAGVQGSSPAHNTFTQLNGGITYTATATQTSTGCVSSTGSVQVLNSQTIPVLTTSNTGSTNCVVGKEDGQAAVATVNGSPASASGFTYAWSGPVAPSFPVTIATNTSNTKQLIKVQGGAGYSYTVQVTDQSNGCQNTAVVNVADAKVLPTLTLTPTSNSICTPGLTSPAVSYNGSVSATVTNQVGAITGYTFSFGGGAGVQGTSPVHNTFTQLNGGITYTATATQTSTGCVSSTGSVQVLNSQTLPVLTTSNTGSTNCVAGKEDGQAAVATVNGSPASSSGFTYSWSGPVAPAFPVTAATNTSNTLQLIKVQGGAGYSYTVQVTDQSNGCQNTSVVNVADAKVLPTLTLTPTTNSICNPGLTSPAVSYNGSVSATVTNQIGAITGYTFSFGGGAGVQGSSPVHNTFTQLNGGITYTATATQTSTGCVSSTGSVQVLNSQTLPVLTTSNTGSTNCVAGKEDGQAAVATVNGSPASSSGFTYSWSGPVAPAFPVTAATNTSNTLQLIKVQGGAGYSYTVQVTDQSNGCQNTSVVNVADAKVLPTLTLTPTTNSICNPGLTSPAVSYNGSVSATVTNQIGAITGYTFSFGGGAGVQGSSPVHNTFTQLNGGITYTATATQTSTGCVSSTGSVQVLNSQTLPVLTTSNTGSTNCVVGKEDGQAAVSTVNGSPASASGFTYAWSGPVAPSFPVTIATNTSDTKQLIKVQGGAGYSYTVQVTDQSNGCQNTAVVTVADAKVLPTLTLSPTSNSICTPGLTSPLVPYNGQVTATVTNPVGAITGYTFSFGGGAGVQGSSPAHNTFTQLNGGITYTVTSTHIPTGCSSTLVSSFVSNNLAYPVLLTSADASTNCIVGKENGAANVINVDGLVVGVAAAALTDYSYQWYDGNTVNPLNIKVGSTNPTLGSTTPGSGIQGGLASSTFTALVTRNADGCQSNSPVTIPDAKAKPVVATSIIQNNTMCVGANGSLTASVTYKGVLQSSPLAANWTMTWQTIPATVATVSEVYSGLTAGSYSASVTDSNTGCTSAIATGTIVDQPDIPIITTTVLNKQTSCDLLNPVGKLQGSATNGPLGSTLKFTWYEGIGTGGTVEASVTGQASGANLQTAGNMPTNNYTFEAVNEITGCTNTSTILLPQQLTYPTFTGAITDVTVCVPSNGQLDITLGTITSPSQYTIYYFNEVNFAQTGDPAIVKSSATDIRVPTDPTPLTYVGIVPAHKLIPGTYTVLVTDEVSHCDSNPVTFTVQDKTNKTVTVSAIVQASACNSGLGGKIDISVSPVLVFPASYSYQWYAGVPTNNNFNFMNNANLPSFTAPGALQLTEDLDGYSLADHAGVGTGLYTVVITDNVGCGKVYSDNVPFVGAPDVLLTLKNSTKCDPLISDASIKVDVNNVFPGVKYSVRLFKGHDSSVPLTWINGEDDQCNDGIDNDGDGLIDLLDSDCGDGNSNFSTTFVSNGSKLPTDPSPVAPLLGDYLIRVFDNSGIGCAIEKVATLEIAPRLPQVTTVLTPSTACTGGVGDGTVQLTVTKDPLDTTTPAYSLTAITPVNISGAIPQIIPEGIPTMVTGTFSAQSYTLTVEDAVSGCSIDQFVNVPSQPGIPTAFTVTPINDELCSPATNGSALVTALTTTAPSSFTDFNFGWYKDNALTSPVVAIAAGDGAGTGGELLTSTKVNAFALGNWPLGSAGSGNGNKTFYVRAQKQTVPGDKCYTSIAQVNISDTHSAPQLNLLSFSNTSCDVTSPEGRIEITASTASLNGAIASSLFTYSWTIAGGSPVGGKNGGVAHTIGSLATNTYAVTALNEQSGCTITRSTDVLDAKFNIAVTDKLITDQDICPVGGQIDVTEIQIDRGITGQSTLTFNGATLSSDFTYEWFKAPVGTPGTFNSATPLQDIGLTTINQPSLITGGGAQQFASMSFGTYYVIATRTNSAGLPGKLCTTQPFRVDVADKRAFPAISFSSLASTSCDANYDGAITVSASTNGFGVGTLYNFDWTSNPGGTVITDGPLAGTVSSYTNNSEALGGSVGERIGPGSYAMTVTNLSNNCSSTGSVTVQQNTVPVEVMSGSSNPLTHCTVPDGSVSVLTVNVNNAGAALGDFSFGWTGSGGPYATSTVSNISSGDYFVTATKTIAAPVTATTPASGCLSAPFKVSVLDSRQFPTVGFSSLASTSCNTNYDGSITVSASTLGFGAGTLYNFDWTSDPGGAVVITDGMGVSSPRVNSSEALGGLAGERIGPGTYGITVTNTVNTCFTSGSVDVQQNTVPVEVMSGSSSPLTHCTVPDGSVSVLTVNVNNAGAALGDFSFGWTGPGGPYATSTVSNLSSGDYFVTATKTIGAPVTATTPASGCLSAPFKVSVLDSRQFPTVGFSSLASTSCNTNYDGSITVSASTLGFGVGTLYNFDWTSNPGGAVVITDGIGVLSPRVNSSEALGGVVGERIGPGTYGITVTNTVNTCFTSGSVDVQQNTVPVEVILGSSSPLTHCTVPDGSVSVVTVNVNNAGAALGDFSFGWTGQGGPYATSTVSNISSGDYFVTATKTIGAPVAATTPASGCLSAPFKVSVLDSRQFPTVGFSSLASTSCNTNYDGSITVSASTLGFGVGTLYNFDWTSNPGGAVVITDGMGVSSPRVNSSEALGGLVGERIGPGTYGITVTNTVNTCFTSGSVDVQQNTVPVEVMSGSSNPLTHCSVPDGSVNVVTVNVNNAGAALGDFSFGWTGPGGPYATGTVSNLASGDYFVTATKTIAAPVTATTPASGCLSAPFKVSVLDSRQFPTVGFSSLASTSCNTNYDGSITVSASTLGFGAGTLYNFDWTSNPGGAVVITDGMGVLSPRVNSSEALGGPVRERIGPGTYSITVTNTVNTCSTSGSVDVQQNTVPVEVISGSSSPLTHCSVPDGSVNVVTVNVNNAGAALGDFSFGWTGPGGSYATGTVSNLASGDYFVTATKTIAAPVTATTPASGCLSAPFKVSVLDSRQFPTVGFSSLASTSCNTNYDGSITVSASTLGFGVGTLYNFDWTSNPGGAVVITDGMGVSSPRVNSSEALGGVVGERIGPGTYGITVTNTVNTCSTSGSVDVQQNTVPVEVMSGSSNPLTHCTVPDGSVSVLTVNVNNAGAALGDFSFGWTGSGGPYATSTVSNISSGDYFVTATKTIAAPVTATTPASGCLSAPFKVSVLDSRQFPTVGFSSLASTSCNTNYDGSITVSASTLGFGVGTLYNFDWTSNPGGAVVITDGMGVSSPRVNSSEALGGVVGERIGPGTYGITVTNTVNTCFTSGSVDVQQNTVPVEVMSGSSNPLTHCTVPDGSVSVVTVNVNNAGAALGDFSFGWTGPGGPYATSTVSNLSSGDYFVTATKTIAAPVTATTPASGCLSAPFKVSVLDSRQFPTVGFSSLASTSCNTNYDGSITVSASTLGFGAGTLYNFDWTSDPGGAVVITDGMGVSSPRVNSSEALGGLAGERIGPGTYGITVTNTVNTCFTSGSVDVQQNTVPVEVMSGSSSPLTHCTVPDGSVSVLTVNVNNAGAALGDFSFGWTGPGGPYATSTVSNLSSGDYFVTATKTIAAPVTATTPASGCLSAPFKVSVLDSRENPTVSLTATSSTTCDANFNGQITVAASTASGPGAGSNYNFVWTNDPDGLAGPLFSASNSPSNNTASPFSTLASDLVGFGQYDIRVTNFTTNCFIDASVTVLNNTPTLKILSVSKLDKRDCAPLDGNITVNPATDLSLPGTYTFTWTKGGIAVPTPAPDNVLDQIDNGDYTVSAQKVGGIGSGCITAPFPVAILDLTANPAIDIASIANIGCTSYTGQLSGSVNGGTAGYSFEWFTGINNTNPINSLGTVSSITNLNGGNYTLYVNDQILPNRNCNSTATINLQNNTTVINSHLAAMPQTLCTPIQDGQVAVTTIDETIMGVTTSYNMSNPVDAAKFQFKWFDGSNTLIAGQTLPTLPSLDSGKYYVQATNNLGCAAPVYMSIVDNLTTSPVITVSEFRNPGVCVLPEVAGMINIEADGSSNSSNYSFDWYIGNNTSGTAIVPDVMHNVSNAPITSSGSLFRLDSVLYTDPSIYTVSVKNTTTKCFTDATFKFKTDTVAIRTLASAIPLTSCVSNNGGLFATTAQGRDNQYGYEWFSGIVTTNPPIYNTQEVISVPVGLYTVRAKHPNPVFNFCKVISDTARVIKDLRYPVVNILPLAPLTYCDPLNPNGAAKADVNGKIVGYIFDWLEGSQTNPSIYFTGSEANNLKEATYFVRATDVISKCPGFASIKIEKIPEVILPPALEILSDRTDCETPNGALSASVNGITKDYIFQWYDGSSVKNNVDGIGEIYHSLDAGEYTATATDRISGCTSPPASKTLSEILTLPEFDVRTVPTECDETNLGGNGSAAIINLNKSDIQTVEWSINGFTITQGSISDLASGDYQVTAISSLNCKLTKDFTIKTDINIYNAVSKNGDGVHEFFEIGCVDKYPDNTVKIFNRAGTLVYEHKHYDNGEGSFNGVSNKGINILGTDLPVGTYFYIIDKGDGSEAKIGYLELLR